jgi:hypothetical protein
MSDQSTRKSKPGPKPRPVAPRFWANVNKDGPIPAHRPDLGPCWEWIGGTYQTGYGFFNVRVDGKPTIFGSHRYAYLMANGPIPDGLHVLHACDNRLCVRTEPEGWYEVDGVLLPRRGHLWLGTQKDNMRDMTIKGRRSHGDDHYLRQATPHEFAHERRSTHARLTGSQVREIRRRYAMGGVTYADLAAEFDTSAYYVGCIIRRERWPHID